MFRSRPLEEPSHLIFSTRNERYDINNTNDDDNDSATFPTFGLDLPTSWTQAFDPSFLRLESLSQTGVSLIDRVIANEQAQQKRSMTTETTRTVDSQPRSPPPTTTTSTLLRQPPTIAVDIGQQQHELQVTEERQQEDTCDEMESIWEQSSQQQQLQQHETNAKLSLTWDDRVESTKPFLTELPLYVSETIFQTRQTTKDGQPNIPVVKEQQLVQSLMQTLQGYPSICFQWNDTIQAFEPRIPHMRMLGVSATAIQTVVEQLLQFGTQMKKIERIIRVCKTNPRRYGLTGTAFACCLADLHLQIQHSLNTVFSEEDDWTVLTVYHHVSTLADVINRLARLVHLDGVAAPKNAPPEAIRDICQVGFYIPTGSKLLKRLYEEIAPLDFAVPGGNMAFYRDLCLGMLCHTSIPYLSMLSEWLGLSKKTFLGTTTASTNNKGHSAKSSAAEAIEADWKDIFDDSPLRDPYHEFFLSDEHPSRESLVDRFQPKKEDELPYFINPMQAGVVLRTGNALQLLRRFQPEHPLCCIIGGEENSSDFMLRWMPLEAQSHEYINKLHAFARFVRQYNENSASVSFSANRVNIDNDDVEMEEPEAEEENNIMPTLKPLDQEIKLVTDFHKTLDTILLCHQINNHNDSDNENTLEQYYIPVLHTITDQSVHQPLAIWCPLVNESAMKLFTEKFHIQAHFELIRRFFLFGDDRFSSAMVDALFSTGSDEEEEDEDNQSKAAAAAVVVGIKLHGRTKQWPPRTSDLNMSLKAVLLESLAQIPADIQGNLCKPHQSLDQGVVDIDDLLTFGVREEEGYQGSGKRWCDPCKIEALDFLYLQYRVPYPLDIIINNRTLDKYKRMFTFLLQLHRINATIKYVYRKLRPRHSSSTSPLQLLQHRIRFQVGQFVNTLSEYVYDTAIHSTWLSFTRRIQQQQQQHQDNSSSNNLFQTMDPIMFGEYHEHVLDRMLYQCFLKQSQQPIKHMLNQVFEDVLAFAMLLEQQQQQQVRHRQRSTMNTTTARYDANDSDNDGQMIQQLEQLLKQFMEHAHQFTKVLSKLHDRGIGRLGNVMNSRNLEGSFGVFGDFHDKLDAKSGQGAFAQELLTRLDMNQYYCNHSHNNNNNNNNDK